MKRQQKIYKHAKAVDKREQEQHAAALLRSSGEHEDSRDGHGPAKKLRQTTKATPKSVVKSIPKPAIKPTAKLTTKPNAKPTTKSTAKSNTKTTTKTPVAKERDRKF